MPIIYTPHQCTTPLPQDVCCPMGSGTLWQCEICESIWEARDARKGQWIRIEAPRRGRRITEATRPTSTAPKVSPSMSAEAMADLVVDAYNAHIHTNVPIGGPRSCAGCGVSVDTINQRTHAREAATHALTTALAAGDEDQ